MHVLLSGRKTDVLPVYGKRGAFYFADVVFSRKK
jgi:hypothetical protein